MVISETVLVPCTITVSQTPFIFPAMSSGLLTIRSDSRIAYTVLRLLLESQEAQDECKHED